MRSVTKSRRSVMKRIAQTGSAGTGCYTHCMTSAAAPSSAFAMPPWRRLLRLLVINCAFWLAVSVLGALTSLNDDLRKGVQGSFWLIWQAWAQDVASTACVGVIIYAVLSRWPRLVASGRNIALCYGALLMSMLPLQMVFLPKLYLREDGPGFTWASIQEQVKSLDNLSSWADLVCVSAVFFAMVAIKVWQQNVERGKVLAQAQADGLGLRLALERQRGLALRAQLEPHFVFNALNAISALVRSDGKDAALQGIQGLSELLRYALAAGERDSVSIAEELGFVEDYLALQRLRYGSRLQVVIDGASPEVQECDCPPLLLQPLVENALRHDLDRHDAASDIHIALSAGAGMLNIRVANPVHEGVVENPGTGLGLRNTAERLKLAYGEAASLQTGVSGGRFEVNICMPVHAREP